ncbi:hypothetical protein JB92DRAFT_3095985 [Gautieria morchelliformis]|nr:hypothetical protein JB92DRAFT_3095985 [Gautieria morchelliformis]
MPNNSTMERIINWRGLQVSFILYRRQCLRDASREIRLKFQHDRGAPANDDTRPIRSVQKSWRLPKRTLEPSHAVQSELGRVRSRAEVVGGKPEITTVSKPTGNVSTGNPKELKAQSGYLEGIAKRHLAVAKCEIARHTCACTVGGGGRLKRRRGGGQGEIEWSCREAWSNSNIQVQQVGLRRGRPDELNTPETGLWGCSRSYERLGELLIRDGKKANFCCIRQAFDSPDRESHAGKYPHEIKVKKSLQKIRTKQTKRAAVQESRGIRCEPELHVVSTASIKMAQGHLD